MPKKLSEPGLRKLQDWLNEQPPQKINLTKMSRDCQDAVAVAQLLKSIFPKLVQMHNYPPRSSLMLKMDNWETLNMKVLCKIGIRQNRSDLERYAKGTAGAIEPLLYAIMILHKSTKQGSQHPDMINEHEEQLVKNDDIKIVNVIRKVGEALVQVPQKMILYSMYEQALCELQAKTDALAIASQKAAHLDEVLVMKTNRIDTLCAQLGKLSMRALEQQSREDVATNNNSGDKINITGNNGSNGSFRNNNIGYRLTDTQSDGAPTARPAHLRRMASENTSHNRSGFAQHY